MKALVRVIGIDDGFLDKTKKDSILVGVISRIDGRIEGILSEKILIDGLDSTEKIASMIKESKFRQEIKILFLHGVNFAGFNIADVQQLHRKLGVPVITCFRKFPDMKKIRKALSHIPQTKKRIKLIKKAGKINSFEGIYFQCSGIAPEKARTIIRKTRKYSLLPEPLRLSHMIASGITKPK
ncbi:MAG: DUF99 family protein [Candidatus Diapherotrites archaeon]